MVKLPVSVIILTKNEELNLPHCLKSIAGWAGEIHIVDSHSEDRTAAVAKEFGAEFTEHAFVNQAEQFNWALQNLHIKNDWILRLDADEVMNPDLWEEIKEAITAAPEDLTGFYLRRRVYFMGRWIKHGGYYPTLLLRLFRKGAGRSENRAMDEHIVLTRGRAAALKHDFKDDNHKSLSFWITKHNDYSSREAQAIFLAATGEMAGNAFGSQAERKRWLKDNVYGSLPLFVRPFLYYVYRYFFRLGFLDGKEGLIFHFLQAFWYRFLVDAKVYEMRKNR